MNRKAHIAVQIILGIIQVVNIAAPILPPSDKAYVALGLTVLQGAVGVINQAFNTDGTPQTTAFKPEDKA